MALGRSSCSCVLLYNPCFYLLLSFHYSVSLLFLKLKTGASASSLKGMPKRKRIASMKDTKSGETTSSFRVTTAPEARSLTDGAKLANGVVLPWIGYGTYKLGKEHARECTLEALRRGYRCIDTAFIYAGETTEKNVGLALQDAISENILKREDVFIITKHWRAYHGYDRTNECLSKSLKRLQVDSIDLWLMHWPGPAWNTMNRRNDVIAEKGPWAYAHQTPEEMPQLRAETWRAMEDAVVAGKVKAIGVSNFTIKHLERLKETATMWPPTVNQVEFHPLYPQEELLEYCANEGIIVQAYASLGGQDTGKAFWKKIYKTEKGKKLQAVTKLWNTPPVLELAEEVKKTPAQVLLRWALQKGVTLVPKTATPERMDENTDIFDFSLSPEQVESLESQISQALGIAAENENEDATTMGRMCWVRDPLRLLDFD